MRKACLRLSFVCLFALGMAGAQALPATDLEISDAIEDEILVDPAVALNNIDVKVVDGVATLSGNVSNLLAKERAARLARTVRGVRSVVNTINVQPTTPRNDTEIASDVRDALLYDPAADAFEVSVTVEDGAAILNGTVDSWQERELALKAAKGVRGVTAVENNISVDYDADRPDLEIRSEVQQALRWDALIDHGLINVAVEDGAVTLSGTVGSAAEKTRAITEAWVAGVQNVGAEGLEVEAWARDEDMRKGKYAVKSDDEVEQAIEDALLYDPRVASFEVTPEVDGGVATLRGTVDNLKAKRAVTNLARNTVGVATVENRIKVRPEGELADAEVAENVRNALSRDPYVDRYEISVTAIDGTAHLYGSVDTYFEKTQAEDVASSTRGVIAVDNNLEVEDTYDPYVYDPYVDDRYVYDYGWYDYEPAYTLKSDTEIEEDVESELWWSPFVDSDDIAVVVEDGTATLTGAVDSWSEYSAATENAYEGGAVWVDNDIVVR